MAGLDIGTTKTCCVLAEVDFDLESVDIIGVGLAPSNGLRRGVVVDLDATTESIRAAVEKAQHMAGPVTIRSVVVGVTGEHISSLNSRGVIAITSNDREITIGDVERVIEASRVIVLPPEREIIHAIPRGFTVDGQDGIKDPVGMCGSRLEVETHIVTGSTAFLDNIVKCIKRAGLDIESTVLEPIATSEAAVLPAERDLGVVLIDIGGGTTDVAVFVNGEIYYTAILPVGGNHVTKDLSVGLRCSQEEAERVKLKYGCAVLEMVDVDDTFQFTSLGAEQARELPREIMAKIIEPRMQEILQMVREEVIKSGHMDLLPAGAVLTGGAVQMPGTVELAEKTLNLPVRMGVPGGVGGLNDTVKSPVYSTAVGLVVYSAKAQVVLHQEEKRITLIQSVKDLFAGVFGIWRPK